VSVKARLSLLFSVLMKFDDAIAVLAGPDNPLLAARNGDRLMRCNNARASGLLGCFDVILAARLARVCGRDEMSMYFPLTCCQFLRCHFQMTTLCLSWLGRSGKLLAQLRRPPPFFIIVIKIAAHSARLEGEPAESPISIWLGV